MGGFRLIDQHGIPTRLEHADIPASHVHILEIHPDEIDDRSKSDFVAKAIIMLQTLWFILQMANRAHQGLMITELEFTTLAHTILNIFVYTFWWNKPVNVRFPLDVYPIKKKEWNPGVKRRAIAETEQFLVAGSGKRRSGRQLSRRIRLGKYVGGVLERGAEDLSWRGFGLAMCIALVGGTFGAIHCFAWNASFPTHIEAKLWRASAIVVTVAPGVALLLALMIGANYRLRYLPVYCDCGHLYRGKDMSTCTRIPCAQGSAIRGLSNALLDGVLATYLLIRTDAMTSSEDHK
jgi:hypothetical protein